MSTPYTPLAANARGEVCAASSGLGGIGRQFGAPDGAFVTNESADPVTGPVTQHRIAVLAAGDEHIRVILLQRRERQMCDRARVAGRDEWCRLWGSKARHIERS